MLHTNHKPACLPGVAVAIDCAARLASQTRLGTGPDLDRPEHSQSWAIKASLVECQGPTPRTFFTENLDTLPRLSR